MQWQDDRCEYVLWLQERLFPDDWEKQALVSWAIYAENFDLTYDPEQDLAALHAYVERESASLRR